MKKSIFMLSIAALLFATSAYAVTQQPIARSIDSKIQAQLPKHYPNKFIASGLITSVDTANRQIKIGTAGFIYGINLKVHTLTSNFGSINNLLHDTSIGYSYFSGADGTFFLTEVWIFPKDSNPSH